MTYLKSRPDWAVEYFETCRAFLFRPIAMPLPPMSGKQSILRITAAILLLAFPAGCFAQIPERMNLYTSARYAELERLVEQEIKDDPQPPSYKLTYLCMAYSNLKKYAQLFHCLDQLEDNVRRGDKAFMNLNETPMLGFASAVASIVAGGAEGVRGDVTPFVHLMRADAYTELRDYDKAIAEGKIAESAIPTRWNQERAIRIKVLTSLGLAHAFAGKKEEARKYAETLLALSTAYPYTALTDDKVTGVAKIYIALGDYKKAYEGLRSDSTGLFAPLLALGDALGGALVGTHGDSIFTYQRLPKQYMAAKTMLEVGETESAKAEYDKLLQFRQIVDNGEIYWMILFDRARIAAGEGDIDGAIGFLRRAIEIIEQQRSSIDTEANKIGFVGDKQAAYGNLIALLMQQGHVDEAFNYVERSKSRALVDMLAGKQDFAAQEADPQKTKELLAQLDASELAARVQGEATDSSAGQAGSAVRNLALMDQQIKTAAPELATLVSVSAVPVDELQALVGDDDTLVEYYYQGDARDLYAFVLGSRQLKAIKLDGTGLDERVRELREAVQQVDSDAWRQPAQALYRQLWQPLGELLTTRNVTVVAHGALHYLPFSMLLNSDGSFLIDRYGVRLLPSASVLKFLKPASGHKAAQLLAFGNPDLGDPKFDLQFAESEARAVAGLFPNSRVLVRKDASKTNFKKAGALFNRIHFATHGRFEADDPLASGIYLAKDDVNDGVLTVGELYSMNLDVDLVTLSACETGLGKVANGDDVVGLTRGFLYAGSRSIVASLWSVDDNATGELMKAFYRNLATMDKVEALRQAQISTRRSFPQPFFWAAFQLTGRAD